MPELIELSHVVEDGMVTYPGLPAPIICDYLSRAASADHYADGTSFHIGRIDMVSNTGTYLDSPFHRYADGKDLADLPLETVAALPGQVVRVPETRSIGPEVFGAADLAGKAVLVHTGWASHWGKPRYLEGHPFLTAEAARYLLECRPALVGIDSLNIDDTADGARPVHSLLLAADIPIVEHLTGLEQLPERGFTFHAAPVKVRGFGTFPVRAYAVA